MVAINRYEVMDLWRERQRLVEISHGHYDALLALHSERIGELNAAIARKEGAGLADALAKARLLAEFLQEAGGEELLEVQLARSLIRCLERLTPACSSP